MSTHTTTPTPAHAKRRRSLLAKENRRLLYGLIIGALVAVFAVLNIDEVAVNWIFGTAQTPLIIVIAVSFLLGALVGYIADLGRRRAKR
jgi:lipopolysaccharide assembly protein A